MYQDFLQGKLEAAECLKSFLSQSIGSDILHTPVCESWDKDGGPVEWTSRAVTVARLNCGHE